MRLFPRASVSGLAEEPRAGGDYDVHYHTQEGSAPSASGAGRLGSVLVFAFAGVILYAGATLLADKNAVFSAFAGFPPTSLAAALGLTALGWLLRGLRFYLYLAHIGRRVPLGYALRVFLASFALTGTPGKMGEAVKGVFLKRDYETPYTQVMAALVVERLTDLLAVLLLASLSVLLFSEWIGAFLGCGALVIAAGALLCLERLYRPLLERGSSGRRLGWVCAKLLDVLLAGRELMTPGIFFAGLTLAVVSWGLEAVSLYLIMAGMGLHATLLEANFVYSFSTLVGALSMLPGGIGGAEAGMTALMAVLGVPYSKALPAVILIRVCTLWFAVFIGVLMMLPLIWSGNSPIEPQPRVEPRAGV